MGETMTNTDSRVTIHMVASLDGFIARENGSVDWLDTADEFAGGNVMTPAAQVPQHLVRRRRHALRRMPSPRARRRSVLFDPPDLDR
jgi:hypothetical protein